jgi:hypothetical protein
MKIITILFVLFCGFSFSQQFAVTPDGLRDASSIENDYLVIVDSTKSAKELYENAINYIKKNYKNPDEVLKSSIENDYIKFQTYAPSFMRYSNSGVKVIINAIFTTELKFKEGKVRLEIINIEMKGDGINNKYEVIFSGGMMSGYIIFKKDGKLFKEEAKIDVENYFNGFVLSVKNAILTLESEEKW